MMGYRKFDNTAYEPKADKVLFPDDMSITGIGVKKLLGGVQRMRIVFDLLFIRIPFSHTPI
jgi:hypothetical protein